VLYSLRQASTIACACRVANSSALKSSSPGSPVDGLHERVLPRRAGFDVGGAGPGQTAVVAPRPGDHLRAVSIRRCTGAPRQATSRSRTSITSSAVQERPAASRGPRGSARRRHAATSAGGRRECGSACHEVGACALDLVTASQSVKTNLADKFTEGSAWDRVAHVLRRAGQNR
jgi:hypothetical protein